MAGIEEAKANATAAGDKVQACVAAITQAVMQADEARNMLTAASQGTSRPEAEQALGLLAQVVQNLSDAQSSAQASVSTIESWVAGS